MSGVYFAEEPRLNMAMDANDTKQKLWVEIEILTPSTSSTITSRGLNCIKLYNNDTKQI